MSVDLTALEVNGDEIMPLDFGGFMPSALGGSTSRFGRMGDRYAAQVSTPSMEIEPDGRRWSAKLLRARKEGGIVMIHQPGFRVGAPGSPIVPEAVSSGRQIPLAGLTPGYSIREGQWFNLIIDGQRYLDQVESGIIASATGTATITTQNLIRAPLTAGVKADFVRPCIEGWIEGNFSIPRATDGFTSFSFTISEKA
ncbi:hypothetical protein [Sphingomonas sp. 3-13AW]|uniref:hypothetical protein n=1 Tax=Sphingomonas sp. 3-13AW TaxID=3050450 RepID=UPI003BB4FF88